MAMTYKSEISRDPNSHVLFLRLRCFAPNAQQIAMHPPANYGRVAPCVARRDVLLLVALYLI
jgi:hypothetical protein